VPRQESVSPPQSVLSLLVPLHLIMHLSVASAPPPVKPAALGSHQNMTAMMIFVVILAVAAGLRAWKLGQLSFWYDEVVTMRLAEAPTPAALIDRLFQIDATRAPLHPFLLQAWIGLFGLSEASGRALSVLCGIVTVGLVCWIGRLVFDKATGLWATGLAAVSPPLVYYSREARMYALLVMITCLCGDRTCPPDHPGTGCHGLRIGTEGRLEGVLDRARCEDGR
jgi:Dolichyl-phosphate-mannose-protein mannosyltransferase